MKFARKLYAYWGAICFTILFLAIWPLFQIFSWRRSWHPYVSSLNRWWARVFFFCMFIPYKVEYRYKPQKGKTYVYCSNHTSWLDIVTLGIIARGSFVYVGKSSLGKIPLFGPIFRKFQISVDRTSRISSYQAMQASLEAIDRQQSVIIFPEGGIKGQAPRLNKFKDGAFRVAVEKQVELLPVSILYNWIIFDKTFLPRWHRGKAIVHSPIPTSGLNLDDIPRLREEVHRAIEEPLLPQYPPIVYEN